MGGYTYRWNESLGIWLLALANMFNLLYAMGFGTGKNMGIRTHHNFVADPEIVGYSVMARCIPCLCHGCLQRFQKPIGERYSNPCDDCMYWTMYLGCVCN